ncbi:MAG: carbonic anhydrase family protein, partial [Planctomycetales bacterium]|nr:carbonic anhydrase family protein [Planctomycetales bacterium]
ATMTNTQQSPINLTNAILADFGNKLSIKWKKSANGKIKKDEHGVQIEFGGDQRQYIEVDHKQFHLVKFHFHHPSEHWLDGVQQTMELHIVHQNIDDGSRVVLGVFIEPSPSAKAVPSLVSQLRLFFSARDKDADPSISTNPLDWLPKDTKHYARYEGS